MSPKTRAVTEFGDFQTPDSLSHAICKLLVEKGIDPASIIEPTFGTGSFLAAALASFDAIQDVFGLEIRDEYLKVAAARLRNIDYEADVRLKQGDFFQQDWAGVINSMPEPILVIGNPPWVTNSELSSIESQNLPVKSNIKNLRGFDALTGRSNFDISEWMLIKLIETSIGRETDLAMLCKTSVARNTLEFFWRTQSPLSDAELFIIDAKEHFSASVDACLLFIRLRQGLATSCRVYSGISHRRVIGNFGYRDGLLIADVELYEATKVLAGECALRWRSGIKHDSSRVMELSEDHGTLINGLGERVEIENDLLFPMLKSSDVAKSIAPVPSKWMIVPQSHPGDDTEDLKQSAPQAWRYLTNHSDVLDGRKSSIYSDSPRFSIFGVGEYSFLPWKVAISGLYKTINFALVSPHLGKPTVLDDTCYFLSFPEESQAALVRSLLDTDLARDFFHAYIFWDSKRPITARLLKKLDISKLAHALGRGEEYQGLIQGGKYEPHASAQLTLLDRFD